MNIKTDFDSQQWELLMRITSPFYVNPIKKDGKYYLNDSICLEYFPVLVGTQYSNNQGISKELANSISWNSINLNILSKDDLSNYHFDEHSLFLLKEHFKMVINYCHNNKTREKATIILNKLSKIHE